MTRLKDELKNCSQMLEDAVSGKMNLEIKLEEMEAKRKKAEYEYNKLYEVIFISCWWSIPYNWPLPAMRTLFFYVEIYFILLWSIWRRHILIASKWGKLQWAAVARLKITTFCSSNGRFYMFKNPPENKTKKFSETSVNFVYDFYNFLHVSFSHRNLASDEFFKNF